MWGNDVHGDCVTAEEAFAKACNNPEIFISDNEVIAWATRHGVLEGANLTQVMQWMQNDGFVEGTIGYEDGPYLSVNWTSSATLQSAISLGPVKIGIAADQIDTVWNQYGGHSGWFATGFHNDNAEDHCVSLCGYGTIGWLAQKLNVQVPAGIDANQHAYAMFTWNTIGIIDVPSLLAITHEAWLRQPTTITKVLLPSGPQASGDKMQPGQVLHPGNFLQSADGRYRFIYQADGNLVLYQGNAPLWASGTNGKGVGVCIMQTDGNLVIYTSGPHPIWASGTNGSPNSHFIIQNDGNGVIYRPDNHAVWATNTWLPTGPTAQGDTMHPGQVLNPGQHLTSAGGRYTFVYQGDGNLVLYDGTAPLWASGTNGKGVGVCIMQTDGNMVIYTRGGHVLWASGTNGSLNSRFIIQADGNGVIYRPDGHAVWATNTWLPTGPTAQGDTMHPGQVLNPNQHVTSGDRRFTFIYQGDGNLVLYKGNAPLWATGTNGKGVGVCIMQTDGNLVIYTRGGHALWASGTNGSINSHFIMQNDGNGVIYRPDNHAVWATNTNGR